MSHSVEDLPSGKAPPRSAPVARRRRQLGGDRRTCPNPAVPAAASPGALAVGRLAILVTIGAWAAYVVVLVERELVDSAGRSTRSLMEAVVYVVIVTFLALSALAYLITRQGYLRRTRSHVRVPRAELESSTARGERSATVLVPSYREQPEVILQTMLSAALQEFDQLRVVLLIDDPPTPSSQAAQDLLDAARATPGLIAEMLAEPRRRFETSQRRMTARFGPGCEADATIEDLQDLAEDYEFAIGWIEQIASTWVCHDHTDDFFVDHVLGALKRDLQVVAAALRGALFNESTLPCVRLDQLIRRLVETFSAELLSFERKQYLNISHEPNKAMNLNGYLGLIGRHHHEQHTTTGTLLLACGPEDPEVSLAVPRPDYIVTLDADSMLLPEYIIRLVHVLEEPESARAGVIQTPYSAFPGSPTRVERLAGATTDIQHIVHQGMAAYGAAFWVGANAVLRTTAVDELRVDDDSEGHLVSRFISDRTVIEDTESTLDLTANGWTVLNYPERLAYSASPPDFGSLCIQRQRWANGGLIILGKLRAHWRAQKERGEKRQLIELLLRLNYLASITWATLGLMLLLAYPFSNELMSPLVVVMSMPYFLVMASDLKRSGHKRTDVLRIYGFNLIMIPVNASGVVRSIGQMISGHKVAFARTPKVRHRSAAPATFVIFAYAIVLISAFALVQDIERQRWSHAVFAGMNFGLALPAIIGIIGFRNSIMDIWVGFANLLYTRPRTVSQPPKLDPMVDWAAVLYHGSTDKPRGPHRPTGRMTPRSTPLRSRRASDRIVAPEEQEVA
jgi:cellulose synthase/poly-beta-1,6-N-acetylglucosamine synthase-like glycosyltransferase